MPRSAGVTPIIKLTPTQERDALRQVVRRLCNVFDLDQDAIVTSSVRLTVGGVPLSDMEIVAVRNALT